MRDRGSGALPETSPPAILPDTEIEFVTPEIEVPPVYIRRRRSWLYQPSERERTLAGGVHAALLLNRTAGITGTLITLLVWLALRQRSAFVRQHAAQALVWQVAVSAMHALLYGGWNLLLNLNARFEFFNQHFLELVTPLVSYVGIAIYLLAAIAALWAAFTASQGRSWPYPLTSRWAWELAEGQDG